jgi:hypothetical protein
MKWQITLHGDGQSGWLVHPVTGEVVECQWSLDYRQDVPPVDPFGPRRFVTAETHTVTMCLELPDDFMARGRVTPEIALAVLAAEPARQLSLEEQADSECVRLALGPGPPE